MKTIMDFYRENQSKTTGRDEVIKALNEYFSYEWPDDSPEVDRNKLDSIGVMFTTCEDERGDEHWLQMTLDIASFPPTLSLYIDNSEDYTSQDVYPSLSALASEIRNYWTFDYLYGDALREFNFAYENGNL